MKRWFCKACAARGVESEWESHLTVSFCQQCGSEGTRKVEFGCFACHEEGVRFWAESASMQPCPQCGGDAFRILYAPAVIGQDKREAYKSADKALETELERQKVSTTTLKREPPKKQAPQFLVPGGWQDAGSLLAQRGAGIGGAVPNLPRPKTQIIGSYDG
ncbi:MAG TPA: hypothetical protein VJ833_10045 [Rhodanobacteraceae bacterium]|nr:hypothetical protein [Rhodanobacteraceae bacterium]